MSGNNHLQQNLKPFGMKIKALPFCQNIYARKLVLELADLQLVRYRKRHPSDDNGKDVVYRVNEIIFLVKNAVKCWVIQRLQPHRRSIESEYQKVFIFSGDRKN